MADPEFGRRRSNQFLGCRVPAKKKVMHRERFLMDLAETLSPIKNIRHPGARACSTRDRSRLRATYPYSLEPGLLRQRCKLRVGYNLLQQFLNRRAKGVSNIFAGGICRPTCFEWVLDGDGVTRGCIRFDTHGYVPAGRRDRTETQSFQATINRSGCVGLVNLSHEQLLLKCILDVLRERFTGSYFYRSIKSA